jgi:hypothetical protein
MAWLRQLSESDYSPSNEVSLGLNVGALYLFLAGPGDKELRVAYNVYIRIVMSVCPSV